MTAARRWRASARTVAVALFAVTVAHASCVNPPSRNLDGLVVVDSLYVDPASGEPFSGRVFRDFTDPAGPAQIEGTLLGGEWHGELVVYHRNGRVRYMGSFARGQRCGAWTENADSVMPGSVYEQLVDEVESLGLYPPCPRGG